MYDEKEEIYDDFEDDFDDDFEQNGTESEGAEEPPAKQGIMNQHIGSNWHQSLGLKGLAEEAE